MKRIVFPLFLGLLCSCVNMEETRHPESVTIREIDLAAIADGVYTGRHKSFPVSVIVRVAVTNHAITGIELVKHFNGQGAPAEAVVDRVIERQSLQVDAVSGATVSSKCILKAIEDALID